MVSVSEFTTIGDAFLAAAQRYCDRPFLAVPANDNRSYYPQGVEFTYADVREQVLRLIEAYRSAGYGLGDRVALLLDNRPEHLIHKIALNAIGACIVPLNPDYRAPELAYVLDHSQPELIVTIGPRAQQVLASFSHGAKERRLALCHEQTDTTSIPRRNGAGSAFAADSNTPASILYTSGTTGRPKGCVLSHRYELAAGEAYLSRGGLATLREGAERIYNPLPLFHVNASILSFYGAMLAGCCQIQTDRFSPARWWKEIAETRATVVHYLGVIVPMLMSSASEPAERNHGVRMGLGAGVEPQLHSGFEERFGFPLLELWGMTEMVRVLVDCVPPRQVGTRAFGRPVNGVEVLVVDEGGQAVDPGTVGQMLIRHSKETPRKDFFSGYLDDADATEAAWQGDWFHTGDMVVQDSSGLLHFVDRLKNIIRRSGENIAAAEVEAVLQSHPAVRQAAVLGVPDEVREQEVLACIVLNESPPPTGAASDQARILIDYCNANLAYYKVPGWVWFAASLPTTSTQKIQKHSLFPQGSDPRRQQGMLDLRALKRRS
jgi:crotonobetaine/carnitine-CoA ligase